jgi:hypothetical protein
MTNTKQLHNNIRTLVEQAIKDVDNVDLDSPCIEELEKMYIPDCFAERFTELIVKECIDKIETYEIYIGNSPLGELARDWTYGALVEIRDEIKKHFGV